METYRTKDIYGNFYANGNKPLVVLINGSRPGIPETINTAFLNYLKDRYNVLLLAYFGVGQLPKTLERVPIEYFINSIEYFKKKIGISNEKIIIIGNSKGAEAALLLAKYYNSAITIGCVPSCYVFQGLSDIPSGISEMISNPKSSWTYKGLEVPYIRFSMDNESLKDAADNFFCTCYEKSIKKYFNKDAIIDVKNYTGKILLLSSKHDPYWPSKEMSEFLSCHNKNIQHICLDLKGHYYLQYDESTNIIIDYLNNN